MNINWQKAYGWATFAFLGTAAIAKAIDLPLANELTAAALFPGALAKGNRGVRRHMPGKFAMAAAEIGLLAYAATSGEEWPLMLRMATNSFSYVFEGPHMAVVAKDADKAAAYRNRDVASINLLDEVKTTLNPVAIWQNCAETVKFYSTHAKLDKPHIYGAALMALTVSKGANVATSHPALTTAIGASILTANLIALERNTRFEDNGTLAIANVSSMLGYTLSSIPSIDDLGLAFMTSASALSALGQCGVKNSKLAKLMRQCVWQKNCQEER